jgi:hypothetical protein
MYLDPSPKTYIARQRVLANGRVVARRRVRCETRRGLETFRKKPACRLSRRKTMRKMDRANKRRARAPGGSDAAPRSRRVELA